MLSAWSTYSPLAIGYGIAFAIAIYVGAVRKLLSKLLSPILGVSLYLYCSETQHDNFRKRRS